MEAGRGEEERHWLQLRSHAKPKKPMAGPRLTSVSRKKKKRKKITASGRQDLTSVFFVFPKVVRKAAYTKLRHAHHAFAKKYGEERKIQILTWQGEKHVFSIKTFLIIFPPRFSKLLSQQKHRNWNRPPCPILKSGGGGGAAKSGKRKKDQEKQKKPLKPTTVIFPEKKRRENPSFLKTSKIDFCAKSPPSFC